MKAVPILPVPPVTRMVSVDTPLSLSIQQRRKRRGHDLRRTFITLGRADGAIDSLLQYITHGPSQDMLDIYSTPPWDDLRREMARVKVKLRTGKIVQLTPEATTASLQRAKNAERRWKKATPTGRQLLGRASIPFELLAVPVRDGMRNKRLGSTTIKAS